MKYTLLEMVQSILTSMDSDEVDAIADTAEARSIAEIIRVTYFNIIARANLTEHQQMFGLSASGDSLKPVLMTRPTNVVRLDWIKYDISDSALQPTYSYVTILPLQQFLEMTHQFNLTATDVDSMVVDGKTYLFKNNRAPTYATVLKDNSIIFDSYKSSIESTLQETKTQCFGLVSPTFSLIDTFIPELDELQFPLLLNEAKSLCFIELKQVENMGAQREAKRQWNAVQKTKELKRGSYFDQLPDFGRKS
jgi:hypothetical protein